MKFILTAGWDDGVADLTERLVRELAGGQRVLWLTSGGSNLLAAVQVMGNIPPNLQALLTVMSVDERYGQPGHSESNWGQLLAAGFVGGAAKLLPVLREGLDFAATIEHYGQLAEQAFKDNQVVIAQLGIGGDGHIAGILPGSPAAAETEALVAGYKSQPFDRLTLTFAGLKKINAAYAFAFGNTKQRALTELYSQASELEKQPAQILKQLPEAYVYNDQVGEDS